MYFFSLLKVTVNKSYITSKTEDHSVSYNKKQMNKGSKVKHMLTRNTTDTILAAWLIKNILNIFKYIQYILR